MAAWSRAQKLSDAKEQYRVFDEKRRALRHSEADAQMADLLKKERGLGKSRRKKPRNGNE